jgi:threonyl-tRNA synthetase
MLTFHYSTQCSARVHAHKITLSVPCAVFNKCLPSWRELLVRYAELGARHRNEPSGSLHRLRRTRALRAERRPVLLPT